MTLAAIRPHPIYLGGRWVESPNRLEITNPARPDRAAGATYQATREQYEEAVQAAARAFEHTRRMPAYERGATGAKNASTTKTAGASKSTAAKKTSKGK